MSSQPAMDLQRSFWNGWNASTREVGLTDRSLRQWAVLERWLDDFNRNDLKLIDVGCGAGWLCERLRSYGAVTGADLADEVLARARLRAPDVNYIAGDFMDLAIPEASFDVTLSLEVLSHVADQPAFIKKLARITRPGGYLLMATQNRPVCKLNLDLPPAQPGQLRRWVNSAELRTLVQPWFDVAELRSIEPIGMGGYLRLVNAPKVNRVMNLVTGRRYDQIKEKLGLGFTLMLKARKRA